MIYVYDWNGIHSYICCVSAFIVYGDAQGV